MQCTCQEHAYHNSLFDGHSFLGLGQARISGLAVSSFHFKLTSVKLGVSLETMRASNNDPSLISEDSTQLLVVSSGLDVVGL